MNAALLLDHYARIADAPDAIVRLRRFVLDLAVRGKLVEQDASDEPASELLKRIAAERARLVKAGTIRTRTELPAVEPQHMPYRLPCGWLWVRFAEIVEFYAGRTPARNDLSYWNTGDHAWVSIADMEDGGTIEQTKETVSEIAQKNIFKSEPEPVGTIVMSFKLTIGKIARLGVPAFHNEAIISIHPHVSALDGYLFMSLPELARAGDTKGAIKGATLNRQSLSNILIPLPPLAEQRRIVAKVDELMALCDQLEAARAEREAARDTFTLSTLTKLNTPDPETFGEDARFALANLAPLTTRADQIKQLRQTILNLAVRGKLVEQNASDIISEVPPLRQFSAASGIDPAVFAEFSKTIVLPSGWQVAPLAQLSENIVDCPHTTPKWKEEGEICIRTNQLRPGALDLSAPRYVSLEEYVERVERLEPVAGDILYSREGGILGIACRVPPGIRLCLGQRLMLIRAGAETRTDFLELVLNSPFITSIAKACTTGGAAPRVNMSTVRAYPIPLPPLAEQHRIVAKVDELMALCDELETSLLTGEQTRSRLLGAVLHHALEPA
ncbi:MULTISPECIES: restriction endonuclease subunit S [unclassified Novosphingobium]|uniref:restriction endonuclease subunit S n=1 Tax=unclassified Novosphingobium TaxID=2644732 RepID=UPI000D3197C6|nr:MULTISPECIES: restriction endonuclease subunit S [unclassified Novosphingobium]PTR07604.1 type I restriction enzyme S subunit [Novosphingobium sp. GV055]PUB00306.1 type I restriction enzyme S subunit [Novosphingobium sp. GV061]PUB15347.1 type I restriction enzyme S subunit [Novosphingobium sp. GV079]PUB39223.1 type I restriction enzyme S subunit [Novosphingobium sp. GV027]